MKRALLPTVSLALLMSAATAQTTSLSVAVVDMTAVFKAHPETAKAEAVLETKRKAAREVFKKKSNELKEVLQKHQGVTQKLVAAGTSASSSLKSEAKTLLDQAMKLEKEVATMRTTQENDLKKGFIAERKRILGLISIKIAEFNKAGTYALILDKSAASANGIPQVLHAPGAKDVTNQIIALVKKK